MFLLRKSLNDARKELILMQRKLEKNFLVKEEEFNDVISILESHKVSSEKEENEIGGILHNIVYSIEQYHEHITEIINVLEKNKKNRDHLTANDAKLAVEEINHLNDIINEIESQINKLKYSKRKLR